MPSQNIQQTYQSQGFREYALTQKRFMTEPHQYYPQQMLMPQVQPSLLQGVDITSHGQDQSAQPFFQQGPYMIGQSFQQSELPSQHHLLPGQPLAQQQTGRWPDIHEECQTQSGRAPQSEHSAHHEGVASSSTDRRRGDKRDRRHRDRVHRSRSQERREKEGWHGNKGTLVKRSDERTEVKKEEVEDVDILEVNASGNEVVSSAADSSEAESGGEEHASHSESEADDAEASGDESSAEESESGDDESGSASDSESGSEEESSSGSSSSSQSDSDSDRDEFNQDKDRRDVGEQHTITDTWEHRENLQRHNDFLKLLLRIAGDLGKDEVKSLKFLCINGKWEILKGEIEDIHDARDLFQKLLDRKLISADDSKVLVDLLQQIERVDLVQKISPIQPHNITESIKWLRKYLQDKYKRHYKAFKPIPWNAAVTVSLTEIYTRLKVIKTDKGLWFKEGQILENELEIFKNTDAELPCRRIAIKGAPAMGKSTFCRKLAYDWACGNLEEKLPQFHFELLFFLEMRHVFDNKRLDDIIFHQLLPEDTEITKDVLYNYIQQNQNLVLCLFDGLDEMASTPRQKSDILGIISEKLLTWCTVVTTTRPNMLHSSLDNCHAHFRIEGFTQTDAVNFISKYFTHVKKEQEAKKLISELKLANVKPLPSYPYKVDDEYGSTEIDSGDNDDKSSQKVDGTIR
ncbi:uncharacterized protein [Ptychodera flava]|uniref:uncharacterized protein n=1 Tax=Ptychodera flava TaxID=63121 RepID=UPI00396A45F6